MHLYQLTCSLIFHSTKAPFNEEELSRIEGLPAYLSYPGRANFSYISGKNWRTAFHEKQNVGSHQAGSPFCDGRPLTLLAHRTLFLFLFCFLTVACENLGDFGAPLCFQQNRNLYYLCNVHRGKFIPSMTLVTDVRDGIITNLLQICTLGARDFSSAVSGFCQVFIVTRAKSLWSRALLL